MADVSKNDCHAIFKRLRSIPTNKSCFDCNSKNSTWASVTYGVFLCIDCSAVHRSLGVHVTFIRSTQLDSWTWPQIRAMQVGGNANATVFFRQHGTSTTDANKKYHSRAAQLYKEKIKSLAAAAMRKYGTESLHIGHGEHVSSPHQKEVDFFKEHTEDFASNTTPTLTQQEQGMNLSSSPLATEVQVQPIPVKAEQEVESEGDTREPSVDHVLGTSPSQSLAKAEPRKSTIGQRKPMSGKKGLGAKKGKLGAQKVTTNFKDIESAAHQADLMRQETATKHKKTKEEEEASMASMRLAYQDMTVEIKKQEERMKSADPKKAEQMERLGMGFGGRSAISHSAMNDMQTIKQERPSNAKQQRSSSRDFFDDYVTPSSSFSSRNKEDPFGSRKDPDEDSEKDEWEMLDKPKQSDNYDSIKPLEDRMSSSRKKQYEPVSSSTEAQKRFANAKGISSDSFFGKSEMDESSKSNLERFSGKSSISSAEFYGEQSGASGSYSSGPDMSAIKDGMKDSVTQVAGRLSRMANGLMSSIQDKYGY